ncbi:YidC/Oxa1 family membrane protein insertase [Natronocella acetinitrilica]|uniref:Membrane protein insertase YidC n=1 Tax=Natronocella acetinitrilica TaxID=414046 RepID=A0AAE3G1B5_9GAMM|nr:membrane protein insertase YidC [Natronocella acetinitrilica]MCP1673373.1 YidC/Oxa1 family membrane protein insertase [Natronocella acetinitrilica]
MDTQRLIQFFALGFILLLIWSAWETDYGTPRQAMEERAEQEQARERSENGDDDDVFVPDDLDAEGPGFTDVDERQRTEEADSDEEGRDIRVRTDLLDVVINTRGGEIQQVDLLQHAVSTNDPTPLRLMSTERDRLFTARAGVVTANGVSGPGTRGVYSVDADEFELSDGEDRIVVPFVWESDEGLRVTKRYIFHRDSYLIDVEHEVDNATGGDMRASQQVFLRRSSDYGDGTSWFIYTYTGGVLNSPDSRYEKISFSDMASSPVDRNISDGWLAIIQHYFLGAWIPPEGEERRYWSRDRGNNVFDFGMNTFWRPVADGESVDFSSQLFVGPKEQDRLAAAAEHLNLTVDYGWLTIISRPLFIALNWIYSVVGNWGFAIIILTLLIKIVFYKLSETSFRSMARMRKMQPKMQALKDRYGDDRQALNQALMKMYKEEKINPLGGCLPILVQIPVFIALYWVLLESVELRHAPFMLWINDLSSPDPFFVLPLLMGATMFIQQKLNPAPLDPIQQKVMMALPFAFTIFFMFFPAGLVLYWVVNNALSIAQQYVITKRIERGEEK